MLVKVLIVEDEPIISADIEFTLGTADYKVVGIAHSSLKALDMLASRQPDMVILDINIKGDKDGIELAEIIREKYNIPFLFLTSYSDKVTLERVKPTLPYGYIVKPFKERDLLSSVEIAIFRHQQEKEENTLSKPKLDQIAILPLTDTEFKIVELLWKGLGNQSIADELFVSVNTVKTHLKNIYEKMEVKTRNELLVKLR
ncbi:MAG: DNA-binding response regulator [Saprospirales bacterium]|nr:MAG: DNA-binding response regulator [Saprospirales bacterium]